MVAAGDDPAAISAATRQQMVSQFATLAGVPASSVTLTVAAAQLGPIARDECPRPSIKWFAKLKEKTAAERCDKWLADAEAGFQEAFTS